VGRCSLFLCFSPVRLEQPAGRTPPTDHFRKTKPPSPDPGWFHCSALRWVVRQLCSSSAHAHAQSAYVTQDKAPPPSAAKVRGEATSLPRLAGVSVPANQNLERNLNIAVRGKIGARHPTALPPMLSHRLRAVGVPQGTIYGLDVDPTNNYIVTAGQVTHPIVRGRRMANRRAAEIDRHVLPGDRSPRMREQADF